MNDNKPLGDYEIPHWACKFVDKHDLGLRADNPLAAATVLLTDAGDFLRKIAATAFREQVLTPSTRQRLREVIDMLTNVKRLSAICEDERAPAL